MKNICHNFYRTIIFNASALIPNDAPNLWDANYARKHAYKGVADGLAGKDVSEDFTGDLE